MKIFQSLVTKPKKVLGQRTDEKLSFAQHKQVVQGK